jgi:uncharacterized protein (TIGR02145 family)
MFALKRWVLLLAAAVALSVAGCSDNSTGPSTPGNKPETWTPVFGTFKDLRDNTEYKTVKLNKATWMAENLNYLPDSGVSLCYSNNIENCDKYGRLYNWTTAMEIDRTYRSSKWGGSDVEHQGVCPAGWHLPSKSEWADLVNKVGGESVAGKKLKSKEGWNNNGNGTDDYGFTALPGGEGCMNGCFAVVGQVATWWTATESDDASGQNAVGTTMSYSMEKASIRGQSKSAVESSVRCVQNN